MDESFWKDWYKDIWGKEEENCKMNLRECSSVSVKQCRRKYCQEIKCKRGKEFNAIAKMEKWYEFNEVTVEHLIVIKGDKSLRRFKLDSYQEGESIVSRKATNLADIKLSTFLNYLRELVFKYPQGATIITPGLARKINGKVLKGKLKLEIPGTNIAFAELKRYMEIAANFKYKGQQYNIEIILRPEYK